MTAWLFLRPLDVLYLRGNSSFGGPGEHAEALMPPWPSVFSGALRSALLARAGVELGLFTDEKAEHVKDQYRAVLGTPSEPGSFRLSAVTLARRRNGAVELLLPMPADLVVRKEKRAEEECTQKKRREARGTAQRLCLAPPPHDSSVEHSGPLPLLPVLAEQQQSKVSGGWWLTHEGWEAYCQGHTPQPGHLVHSDDLWETDFRLGIARSRTSFTAAEGRIYTTQAVAMQPETGFAVEVDGCPLGLLEPVQLLRLGGDGRGAEVRLLATGLPAHEQPAADQPFLVYCLTPGLFPRGWLPPGVVQEGHEYRLRCEGLEARLAGAVVGKPLVVSGWDLPAHRPKPAQRTVPAGAVYYFDEVKGSPKIYREACWELAQQELVQSGGPDAWDTVWKQRKAEGFNNVLVAAWPTNERRG